MIPSILASHLQEGVEEFLRTTFPFSTPHFHGLLDRFFEEEGRLFKGPYLSAKLPFKQGDGGKDFFPDVPMSYDPYLHQEQAFRRLGTGSLRSTIVATGTGSGKTESFLIPILNHCYQHRGERGIKALIIYPMNALATDQARRIAELTWTNSKLKGQVTAGLFVGGQDAHLYREMGADHIITDKNWMRKRPPDILLTNYKMLDYLLVRPRDRELWAQNSPETLQYLAVDELHTFDGAQGADLACLIRRLKARLKTPDRFLCCVGTSATLGGSDSGGALRNFATEVFGEPFDESSIITESRQNESEFLADHLIEHTHVPEAREYEKVLPAQYASVGEYVDAQLPLWGLAREYLDDPIALGEALKSHLFFRNLLTVLSGKVVSYADVLTALTRATPELQKARETHAEAVLNSLISLIAFARNESGRPFLDVRLQLWLRELRRMVCEVGNPPELTFSDDLAARDPDGKEASYLPLVHCLDCGSSGWVGIKQVADTWINSNLKQIYTGFFGNAESIVFAFPDEDMVPTTKMKGVLAKVCGECLHVSEEHKSNCNACGNEKLIRVFIPDNKRTRKSKDGNKVESNRDCPYCSSKNSLTILGSRAASLTSVFIAQLFSSSYNQDKKLIAFSDSVQDASHRAGFFTARTYRFNMRTALQQCVQAVGEDASLSVLSDHFIQYWSDKMGDKEFVATFLGPNMAWMEEYDEFKQFGAIPEDSQLLDFIHRRIDWEIYSEYAFRARIGRTLEKSNASILYVDEDTLDAVCDELLPVLQNEFGGLRGLELKTLKTFLLGWLTHMRTQGGVFQQDLDTYLADMGNAFLLNRKPHLPNFGINARTPAFLTTRSGTRFDAVFSGSGSGRTWSEAWATKLFDFVSLDDVLRHVLTRTLSSLVKGGILETRQVHSDTIWGLSREALKVTTEVRSLRCVRCGHQTSIAGSEQTIWDGAPCLRFRCSGKYEIEPYSENYYRQLYTTGDVKRIFGEEHTGLLPREDREKVEIDFIGESGDSNPWDPNLLSCTPTLEMGIDIGKLSSVILCSVPPAQSNYLQRIGRAGRKNGNALNIAIANGRPHDLYFFEEPIEMIAGHVETPRIFLNASAVLERQFTAFCFDRWVESGIPLKAIPQTIGKVLDQLDPYDEAHFPYNLLQYIDLHRQDLFDRFIKLFGDQLEDTSKTQLSVFVYNQPVDGDEGEEGLDYKMISELRNLLGEQSALRKRIQTINTKIRQMKAEQAPAQDHEKVLADLEEEKTALNRLVKVIRKPDPYNFLTDEGLLPNYIFPEAGVTLRSVIYRRKRKANPGESPYHQHIFEYERQGGSAIHELAPANHFYAQGRKVQIDQINMNLSKPEDWRFCDQCSYAQDVAKKEASVTCPRCGSQGWSDVGQVHRMIRLRQVMSSTPDFKSRISDDSDDREPEFYNRATLVDFEPSHVLGAYQVEDTSLSFGFEFLRKATLREMNFGRHHGHNLNGQNANGVSIAGNEVQQEGFQVCRHCGKVKISRKPIEHALWCPMHGKPEEEQEIDPLFLYREFTSEAIRMLLPFTGGDTSMERLHSFIAALMLGLERRFGRIDHLDTTIQEEPISGSVYRKQYLVVYDKVPGGTGYLKQLMMRDAEPVLEILQQALDALKTCSCNRDPDKDGCYRCLYAYRNSYDRPLTSKRTAIKLLSDMLARREKLGKVENLRNVSIDSSIESELELRFLEAFRQLRKADPEIQLTKQTRRGKTVRYLQIGSHAYYIEPQVSLGEGEGVIIPSRADFVIWPARETSKQKPIAVFTDGIRFHRDRVGLDMAQRMAIVRSGRFITWSLSWKDIYHQSKDQGAFYQNYLSNWHEGRNRFLSDHNIPFRKGSEEDSFTHLVHHLRHPYLTEDQKHDTERLSTKNDLTVWERWAFTEAVLLNFSNKYEGTSEKWKSSLPEGLSSLLLDVTGERQHAQAALKDPLGSKMGDVWGQLDPVVVAELDIHSIQLICLLDDSAANRQKDGFEFVWNGYLRLYNLLQFLPGTVFVTTSGLDAGVFDRLEGAEQANVAYDETVDPWVELREFVVPEVYPVLEMLMGNDLPPPIAGYELVDDNGIVIAEAELAYVERKEAFLIEAQFPFAEIFEQQGWTAIKHGE